MMKLLRDRRGAQMVEYLLLIGVVVLLSVMAFRSFGFKVRAKVDKQTEQVVQDDKDE
jgi:Flp pilus assembly pilin Flp